jgi:DNA-binding MarR family transcriptional regulator
VDARINQLRFDLGEFNRRVRRMRERHELTASQLQALTHVDLEGPMNARELAEREGVAPQSIARTVRSLEAEGMVARSPDPDDARAVLIEITERGRRTLDNDRGIRNRWLEQVLADRCTDTERELLFLAGGLLRALITAPDFPAVATSGRANTHD